MFAQDLLILLDVAAESRVLRCPESPAVLPVFCTFALVRKHTLFVGELLHAWALSKASQIWLH